MHKQAGVSFLGILILLALGGFVAYGAMRVGPMYMEFWTVEKTLQSVADEAKLEKFGSHEARLRFDRVLDVNTIDIVTSRDLVIDVGPEGTTLSVAYEKCAPFVDRLKLCGDFEAKRTYKTD